MYRPRRLQPALRNRNPPKRQQTNSLASFYAPVAERTLGYAQCPVLIVKMWRSLLTALEKIG
jgi:hypothetical protein